MDKTDVRAGERTCPRSDRPTRAARRKPPVAGSRHPEPALHYDVDLLLKAAKDARRDDGSMVTAITVLSLTGPRRVELLGVRWGEIDLGAENLGIRKSKTAKGLRTLPLSKPLREHLVEQGAHNPSSTSCRTPLIPPGPETPSTLPELRGGREEGRHPGQPAHAAAGRCHSPALRRHALDHNRGNPRLVIGVDARCLRAQPAGDRGRGDERPRRGHLT